MMNKKICYTTLKYDMFFVSFTITAKLWRERTRPNAAFIFMKCDPFYYSSKNVTSHPIWKSILRMVEYNKGGMCFRVNSFYFGRGSFCRCSFNFGALRFSYCLLFLKLVFASCGYFRLSVYGVPLCLCVFDLLLEMVSCRAPVVGVDGCRVIHLWVCVCFLVLSCWVH